MLSAAYSRLMSSGMPERMQVMQVTPNWVWSPILCWGVSSSLLLLLKYKISVKSNRKNESGNAKQTFTITHLDFLILLNSCKG